MVLITVVMAYYNRMEQLLITLRNIRVPNGSKVEVIITDDASDEQQRLESVVNSLPLEYTIRILRIEPKEKRHVNPCYAYNMAIREIDPNTDIVIIQNPEVCYVGDVMKYVVDNLKLNDYMTFKCYGSADISENVKIAEMLEAGQTTELRDYIFGKTNIGGNSLYSDKVGGWLNNEKHSVCYHYLIAMRYSDLMGKMSGGFDPSYSEGLCHDDDDFVRRAEAVGMRFVMPNEPYSIHLWHSKPPQLSGPQRDQLWKRNNGIFVEKMRKLGAPSGFPYFVKVEEIK